VDCFLVDFRYINLQPVIRVSLQGFLVNIIAIQLSKYTKNNSNGRKKNVNLMYINFQKSNAQKLFWICVFLMIATRFHVPVSLRRGATLTSATTRWRPSAKWRGAFAHWRRPGACLSTPSSPPGRNSTAPARPTGSSRSRTSCTRFWSPDQFKVSVLVLRKIYKHFCGRVYSRNLIHIMRAE
jgi:hypothetical protein